MPVGDQISHPAFGLGECRFAAFSAIVDPLRAAGTGSTGAGRKVAEIAGRNLKKVSLELGGKNPMIILEDADAELAASNAAFGSWTHQGQICMASSRIFVQESIAEEFETLLARASAIVDKPGVVPAYTGDALAAQMGIFQQVADLLQAAGMLVVMDRCLKVEHARLR